MKVSPHFKRSEFACNCDCGFEAVDVELLTVLEDVRCEFGRPVKINSGCRCKAWNTHEGGSTNSYHMKGMAADIKVKYTPASVVQEYLTRKYTDRYGIGSYPGFTHIDVRRKKKRW